MKNFLRGVIVCFILIVGFIIFSLSHQIGGWRAFIVSSGSMEPTISTGALVISHYTHPSSLQKNDIITFIAPTKEKPIVTHRISNLSRKNQLTTFKTKGDNNNNEDTWVVAGGGVIGKVTFSIPYLGYFFSFSQTKLGILLLVLLPAVYIIIDEISNIVKTIKHHHKKSKEHKEIITAGIAILFSLWLFTPQSTQALLSDKVSLTNNSITIAIVSPTITQTPSPTITPSQPPTPTQTLSPTPTVTPTLTPTTQPSCGGGNITINVNNNGGGSTNIVNVTSNCSTKINQNNTTIIYNTLHN